MIENDQDLSVVTGVLAEVYESDHGRPFGSFYRALLRAVACADGHNRKKIAKGFPLLVQAYEIATTEYDGRETLENAVKDYRARVRFQRAK